MRYIFLLFCFAKLNAQTTTSTEKLNTIIDITTEINGNKIRLSRLSPSEKMLHLQRVESVSTSPCNMPNALNGYRDKQQLVGNNNQGFDVYKSQVDNMIVLKPDSSNLASLVHKPITLKGTNGSTVVIKRKTPVYQFKKISHSAGSDKKLLDISQKETQITLPSLPK